MLKSFVIKLILLFVFKVAICKANYAIRRIDISEPEEGSPNRVGVVNGARPCGGPGQFVEWRVQGCHNEGVCKIPADGQPKLSEFDFVPSQDASGIGIRFIVYSDGTENTAYDKAIADSSVEGGHQYTVTSMGSPSKDMKGKFIRAQFILYRVEDGDVDVCAEADFEMI